MVTCKHCQKENSLDSRFCRSCGVGLPEDEIKEQKHKYEELLADGYRNLSNGQTEDAHLIAEACSKADPTNTSALSLLGMCQEREGHVAEALECYENVLNLNPDSTLDRIKVNQLRNMLAAHMRADTKPNRKVALIGAFAAVVLFASVGGVIAMSSNKKSKSPEVVIRDPGDSNLTAFSNLQDPKPTATDPKSDNSNQAGSNTVPDPRADNTAKSGTNNPSLKADAENVRPWLPGNGNVTISPPSTVSKTAVDPDPGPDKTSTEPPKAANPEPTAPKEDNGVIMITRSKGGTTPTKGGTEDVDRGSETKSFLASGREQFQLGRYESAAQNFERALAAGADGALNQRLAQCYEKLGRSSDAISAYKKAISALESNPDSARNRSTLDSCKQALKLLKG